MQTPLPLTRDLVLIGGGHAHALVLRMWGMKPVAGVRLTLINPGPTAPYSGMLPGHIAGHYAREELDIDLVRLARFANARLILAPATDIDPAARTVTVEGRGPIRYDVASIDVGIHAEMPDLPGFSQHATGAKPLDVFAARWRAFRRDAADGKTPAEVAVIGGGVAGVELSLAMAHALTRDTGQRPAVTVIEAGPSITGRNKPARKILARAMHRLGVTARTSVTATRVTDDAVHLSDGTTVPSRFTVTAAGAHAHSWLAEAALPVTEDGFVEVAPDLRVRHHDDLFAVGDCAHLGHAPRPKAGVFAVRAAPVLFDNLRAVLTGGRTRAFRPQKDYLKLVSLGEKSALAEKWGVSLAAPLLWRWKDRIDRGFMDRFRNLPEMPQAALPPAPALGVVEEIGGAAQPLCGGCGSKVAPGALAEALATLPRSTREDVRSGPGDDAAILRTGDATQVLTTDHLRAFTSDWALMARITAIHALGDIWAMGARPQAALVSVTLPRMSPALQSRTLDEILREAGEVFDAVGAAIVGGHSTMGTEMTIGFTLTGLCPRPPITNMGAKPGDALILTRPIGSGTILAGEMQGRADGRDVTAMLQIMSHLQGDAAEILQDAHAMTDVTGFGLAGHLMAICRASRVSAEIDPEAVPVYDGALALADSGVKSTIWAANQAAAPVVGASGALGALLHDPQTAGGLLAAVDAMDADGFVARLRSCGHRAARIGRITEGAPSLTVAP